MRIGRSGLNMAFEDCVCCIDAIWNYGKHDNLVSITCGIGLKPSVDPCIKEGKR